MTCYRTILLAKGESLKDRAATTFEGMLRRGGPPVRALPVSTISSIEPRARAGLFFFRRNGAQPSGPVPYSNPKQWPSPSGWERLARGRDGT